MEEWTILYALAIISAHCMRIGSYLSGCAFVSLKKKRNVEQDFFLSSLTCATRPLSALLLLTAPLLQLVVVR